MSEERYHKYMKREMLVRMCVKGPYGYRPSSWRRSKVQFSPILLLMLYSTHTHTHRLAGSKTDRQTHTRKHRCTCIHARAHTHGQKGQYSCVLRCVVLDNMIVLASRHKYTSYYLFLTSQLSFSFLPTLFSPPHSPTCSPAACNKNTGD